MSKLLTTLSAPPPTIAYARLLVDMHRLIIEGQGDAEEAEQLAERMDGPWYQMTSREQTRMRGLAHDLNVLREGAPKRVEMTPEELASWKQNLKDARKRAEEGDIDAFLAFLRHPVPGTFPTPQMIPFMQAHCWEMLGDLETALLFTKEAHRIDSNEAISVLMLLERLGHTREQVS